MKIIKKIFYDSGELLSLVFQDGEKYIQKAFKKDGSLEMLFEVMPGPYGTFEPIKKETNYSEMSRQILKNAGLEGVFAEKNISNGSEEVRNESTGWY